MTQTAITKDEAKTIFAFVTNPNMTGDMMINDVEISKSSDGDVKVAVNGVASWIKQPVVAITDAGLSMMTSTKGIIIPINRF